ncbi:hypothetical protein SADUNF_Sadunf15G0012100 [Salix dunnii]|uniref:Uncharacterized protein n=1 Tax=Salix dunnii TaxID=1413687 RepID=A0A835JFD2_9ROSI|nr:hypothetical protein SADUNF_Sadunf15G0012100 [Salix dunnii]
MDIKVSLGLAKLPNPARGSRLAGKAMFSVPRKLCYLGFPSSSKDVYLCYASVPKLFDKQESLQLQIIKSPPCAGSKCSVVGDVPFMVTSLLMITRWICTKVALSTIPL